MMVYHTSYKSYTRQEILNKADRLNAIIVDVRLNPYSKFYNMWNKDVLENFFLNKYIHIKELGNLNFNTNKDFDILNLNEGINKVLEILRNNNVIIFCACLKVEDCHRKMIIEGLIQEGVECEEL